MRRTRKKRTAVAQNNSFSGAFRIQNKPEPACQCADPFQKRACRKRPINGSLFCSDHQGCPGSPQSGYEPRYEPDRYNNDAIVRLSHNCYSYGMNVIDPLSAELCKKNGSCRQYFHQPGALHGDRNALNTAERRECPVVERLQKADNPSIQKTSFYHQCPTGSSKIALVVDPGEDYHYYRQDANGMWSHKDGSNKVKQFDALKQPIVNPQLASRDYRWQNSELYYRDFCGFYCVRRDGTVRLGRGGASQRKPKVQAQYTRRRK